MRWLSFAIDLRALALFRVGLAATVLVDVIDRSRALELQTQAGPAPVTLLRSLDAAPWSLHALGEPAWTQSAQLAWQWGLAGLTAAVAVALGVGFKSRWMSVLALALVASVQNRTQLSWFFGDSLLIVMLFWACFLPLGARLSVDAKGSRAPGEVRSIAATAALLQPVLLYVCSVFWKLSSESWRQGETVALSLSTHLYASTFGVWVLAHAPTMLLAALTWLTLVVEGPVALLLLAKDARLRMFAVMSLALLQAGLDATMTVGWFTIVSVTATLPALPSALFRSRPGESARDAEPSSSVARALAAVAFSWVVLTNVLGPFVTLPKVRAADALGLTQRWAMFVEGRALPIGYFYVIGARPDGVLVEVMTGEERPRGTRPTEPFARYASFRERQALNALLHPGGDLFLQSTGAWLCQRTRARGESPVRIEGYFADQHVTPTRFAELFKVSCEAPALTAGR